MINEIIGLFIGFFFSLCMFIVYQRFLSCKHEYVVVKELNLVEKAETVPYGISFIKQCKKCGNIKHKTIKY